MKGAELKMKDNVIWIDLRNKDQVDWWNNVASKMVKVVSYNTIVETATNKLVGVLFMIKGLYKNKVVKENLKFISKSVTATFKVDG